LAVVVTYQPVEALLSQLLLALSPQVSGGIVINNGSALPLSDDAMSRAGFEVRHLHSNTGVATALNIGFQWAQAQGAEFVITFDQDSEPASNMVGLLFDAYRNISATGQRVGAVGPQQVDARTGMQAAFIAPIGWSRRRIIPITGKSAEVDHLITSGCLVPLKTWKKVGPFLDDLFVDYVDIEWCLRMRHAGLRLFGVGGAILRHALGEEIKNWCGLEIPRHSPQRQYFMMRNCVYLQKLPYIPLRWKLFEVVQLAKRLVFFTFSGLSGFVSVRAMLHGIRDGLRGKLGPATRHY
jgi:rhamnosyltransferase